MQTIVDKYATAKKRALRAYRLYDRIPSRNEMTKKATFTEWKRLESIVESLERELP